MYCYVIYHHRPHLPSSPFPFVTTSLRHHFPSSPLPFVTTSLRHHFPSSPLPFVTQFHRFIVLHQGQFHFPSSPLTNCYVYVLLCYVLLCDLPPFIKVNSTASYSFVVYCYAMYCSVIYHPSSRSIPPLLILLLCIVMLCIVRSRTTLHHSQFHQVKVIRNSEVLLPNFLWLICLKLWAVLKSALSLLTTEQQNIVLHCKKRILWRSSILGKLDYFCLTCVLFPLVRSAQPSFRQLSLKEMFSIQSNNNLFV